MLSWDCSAFLLQNSLQLCDESEREVDTLSASGTEKHVSPWTGLRCRAVLEASPSGRGTHLDPSANHPARSPWSRSGEGGGLGALSSSRGVTLLGGLPIPLLSPQTWAAAGRACHIPCFPMVYYTAFLNGPFTQLFSSSPFDRDSVSRP